MRANRSIIVGALSALVALIAFAGCGSGSSGASPSGPSGSSGTGGGIDRKVLAQDEPANAPGQTLYLEEVTIAPGTDLPQHFHDGTQDRKSTRLNSSH